MSHTILLVQLKNDPASRVYSDYETVDACLESVCRMYEAKLKESNPWKATATYQNYQLFNFIDHVNEEILSSGS